MPEKKYAAIDLGSNTLRLMIAIKDDSKNAFEPVRIERIITRLGENFGTNRTLKTVPVARTISALKKFAEIIREEKASKYAVAATAVVREARNRDWFASLVKQETGLSLKVLTGTEEAILSLKGVFNAIKIDKPHAVVVDIGGGSTEVIVAKPASPPELLYVKSLPLGVVKLTEAFLTKDPPGLASCDNLKKNIEKIIEKTAAEAESSIPGPYRPLQKGAMIATAGTPTTLAAIFRQMKRYDPKKITGTILKIDWLKMLARDMANLPVKKRKNITGLEEGREDIILAGIIILTELMEIFGFSELTVCDSGLLEGLIWDLIDRNPLVKW